MPLFPPCVPPGEGLFRVERARFLDSPLQFHAKLLEMVQASERRLSLSTLYLSAKGPKSSSLLRALVDRKRARPGLDAVVAMDRRRAVRDSRAVVEALEAAKVRVVLVDAQRDAGGREVGLGAARWLPRRADEVLGVMHVKAIVADDEVLMTGANLSEDYFTNREDRYVVLSGCRGLADLYFGLAGCATVRDSARCFQASPRDVRAAGGGSSLGLGARPGLLALATLQHGPSQVEGDRVALDHLIRSLSAKRGLTVATAYFNMDEALADPLWDLVDGRSGRLRVVTASPRANGFFGSSGLSGRIPDMYASLESDFFEAWGPERCEVREYTRPGWTFHAKGLWGSSVEGWTANVIGSSNFGHRSFAKDLESNLVLLSQEKDFAAQTGADLARILAYTEEVLPNSSHPSSGATNRRLGITTRLLAHLARKFL